MATKEVYFNLYCYKCEHKDKDENDPSVPCYDCLAEPANEDSHKPLYFKEK